MNVVGVVELVVEAGPDSGTRFDLPAGRHRIGRSHSGSMTLRDPSVEAHHGVIDVAVDGTVEFTQLTGRVPIHVDGRAVGSGQSVVDSSIEIGDSRVVVRPALSSPANRVHAPGVVIRADHDTHVWSRRPVDGDAFVVTLGVGVAPQLGSAIHHGRPLLADLEASGLAVIGLCGPDSMSVARSILTQLARQTGPADWLLLPVLSTRQEDRWLDQLPHLVGSVEDGSKRAIDAAADEPIANAVAALDRCDSRRLVIVTDTPRLLRPGSGPLARLIESRQSVTVLVVVPDGTEPPEMCSSVLTIGARWRGRWVADTSEPTVGQTRLHVGGSTLATALERASELADLIDPDDPSLVRLDGSIVTQQVARTGAPVGGDIIRVPEPTRGERETSASDAPVELVAHAGDHGDLLSEARAP